jgi:FkbM family methyltransferase
MTSTRKAVGTTARSTEYLRAIVSVATAPHRSSIPGYRDERFRHKTAQWLDDSFFALLAVCEADSLVECGAHEAAASSRFMRLGGKMALAIEANPNTYAAKTKLAEKDGVVTVNCGVGAHSGESEFHVPRRNSVAGNASFFVKPGEDFDSIRVPMRTLDELCTRFLPTKASVAFWIDVEGMTLDVLSGARSLLGGGLCRVMKLEVETKPFWEHQALASDVDDYLRGLGYEAVLRDIEYDRQYNVIYVSQSFLDAVDEVVISCWGELARLRLGLRDKFLRVSPIQLASHYKNVLTHSRIPWVAPSTHRVSALLGSESSRRILSEMAPTLEKKAEKDG